MKKTEEIKTISEIVSSYDIFFIDLWGVIHNGVNLFDKSLDTLAFLKKQKKKIFFLTNAPRRSHVIAEQLREFGLNEEFYDYIISSGELTWLNLKNKQNEFKRCYQIGPERDLHLTEGLDIEIVNDTTKADVIVNTGPWGDDDTLETYKPILNKLIKRKVMMICSNPDKKVIRGEKFMICAGLLAEYYESIGGIVQYFGKPHKQIYEYCFNIIEKDSNIIVIGDSLDNDIKGANLQNLDSVLITDGIHREVNNNNDVDKEKLDGLINKKNICPKYFMRKLTFN